MTKSDRQLKILEIIDKYTVSTQADLTKLLTDAGCDVTQATTSRDLQEMRIVKVMTPDGVYKYASAKDNDIKINDKLQNVFAQCLVGVDYAMNNVVLKTMSGAAQAVAYALDTFTWQEIVGSIAGGDTVMIVVRNEKSAKQLVAKLAKYIHH